MSDVKQCSICGKDFPATSEFFYRHPSCNDGLLNQCKTCKKQYIKEHQQRLKARDSAEVLASRPPQKRCSVCKETFPATTDYFHRSQVRKDGLLERCKSCANEAHRKHYDAPEVRERHHAQQREYNSRPEVREQRKAYYNRQDIKERGSIWRKKRYQRPEFRDKLLARQKAYRNRPGIRESRSVKDRAYHQRPEVRERLSLQFKDYINRPGVRERKSSYLKDYYKLTYNRPEVRHRYRYHDHLRRARKKAVQGSYIPAQIQEQLKRQNYCCYYAACGFAKFERVNGRYVFEIEHTYPLSRVAGTDIPANDMSYLVLSCPSCNDKKGTKFPWEWPEGGRLL